MIKNILDNILKNEAIDVESVTEIQLRCDQMENHLYSTRGVCTLYTSKGEKTHRLTEMYLGDLDPADVVAQEYKNNTHLITLRI